MTLPTSTPTVINQGANQIQAGAPSVLSLLLNVPAPANAAVGAGHGLAISNASKSLIARSDVNGLKLDGGEDPVAEVWRLTYTGQPSENDPITLGSETFTAETAAATANEFTIGADAEETYDNLVAKVLAKTGTTLCTGVNTGSGANGTVDFTANTPGVAFTHTETLGNASGASVTANDAGTKASALIDLEGKPFGDTYSEIEIPVDSQRSVHVRAKVEADVATAISAGTSQAGAQLTNLMDALAAALNEDGSTEDLPYHSSKTGDSEGDIADFMETLFGTDSSFSIVSNQLKIEAASVGTDGNNIKIYTRTLPSYPSPLPEVFQTGVPDFDEGEVIHAGLQDEGKVSTTITNVAISASNAFGEILNITTNAADVASIKLFINRNSEFLRALVRNGLVTYDPTRNIYMSSNEIATTKLGIFLAHKSKDIKGAFDCTWYYDVTIEGELAQEQALGAAGGYTLTLKINQDLSRPIDPRFIRWITRALAA